MDIKSAKYVKSKQTNGNGSITITLGDDTLRSVPLVVGNRHYDEIMKQVKAGTLKIKDAD